MFRSLVLAALAVAWCSAFAPTLHHERTQVKMNAEVDRRTMLANAAAFAAVLMHPDQSSAFSRNPPDNEVVKEQRQVVGKIDINNSPVADYMQLPGMYPTIGGKIASNGPYDSVKDVYEVLGSQEKATMKKYEKLLTVTPYTGLDSLRGRDPYRTSFNQMAVLKSE